MRPSRSKLLESAMAKEARHAVSAPTSRLSSPELHGLGASHWAKASPGKDKKDDTDKLIYAYQHLCRFITEELEYLFKRH